uniref:Uncharacterized protein n=1 Tax=viral metagenome TaxID=1070528 RepID=A0A6C0CFG0_9ZZZZ
MATQKDKFCKCVKAVRRTVKLNKKYAKSKEGAAIAICTRTILFPRGRTLKKLRCGKKGKLTTQKRK